MSESKRRRWGWWIAGALLLSLIVAAFVILAPWFAPASYVILASPPRTDAYAVAPGAQVPITGTGRRLNGCTIGQGDEAIPIEGDTLEGTLTAPSRWGRQLLWMDIRCDDHLQHRIARYVDVGERTTERPEVFRAHLESADIEARLREELPPAINAETASLLPSLRSVVANQSAALPVPDWLFDAAVLGDETRIMVEDARVRFSDEGIYLDLDVTLDLYLRLEREPGRIERFVRPGSRDGAAIPLHIHDRFAPAAARVTLRQWPSVELVDLSLQSTACADQVAPPLDRICEISHVPGCGAVIPPVAEALCDQVVDRVYVRVARWIEGEVNQHLTAALEALDLPSFLDATALAWAESVAMDDRVQVLLDQADLDLTRVHQDDTGVFFSVTADADWLEIPTPGTLELIDTDAHLDVIVSTALLNRVLSVAFDRPLLDVLDGFMPLAQSTGAAPALQSAIDRVQWVTTGQHDAGPMLDALQLEVAPDFQLTPVIGVDEQGAITASLHDVQVLQSTETWEHAAIAFSADSPLDVRLTDIGFVLEPDRDHVIRHLAAEVVSTTDVELDRKTRVRLEALGTFLHEALRRMRDGDLPSHVDAAIVDQLLAALPVIPRSMSNGIMVLELTDIEGDAAHQAVVFRGNVRDAR